MFVVLGVRTSNCKKRRFVIPKRKLFAIVDDVGRLP